VSSATKRVEKLESGLTPKQAMLLWLQEIRSFGSVEDYVRQLKTQPETAWPIPRLTQQVAAPVKNALKGMPREQINQAIRQAHKDVLFLFYLHQQVNGKLLSENRHYWTRWLLLSKELKSLLREQSLERRMRWNSIRFEMEMPYPLDPETAAAVEAAQRYHVMNWEVLEEGDELDQWVTDSFSDVSDEEYDAHYEAIVIAIKGLVAPGVVVELPTVPHQFLREAPLVDGDWIDRYTAELAEWGARLVEKGFLLEDSDDGHPMAWQRIINPEDGSEADAALP